MTQPDVDLTGRKVLVLGANQPVAAAVALTLAKAGADVAVTSSNGDPQEAFELRPLRRKIEAEGRQAIADIADLGNGSSVQIAVRQIAKQFGRIDVALVCAGERLDKPSTRVSDAEWSRALGYNLGAYFFVARAAARELESNEPVDGPRGRIIALLPPVAPEAGAIEHAARAGTEALLVSLGRELEGQGITVDVVAVNGDEDAAVADVLRLLGG